MNKKKIIAFLAAAIFATSLWVRPTTNVSAADSMVEARSIVSEMTLDEKIGQMLMPDFRQWKQETDTQVKDFTEMNQEVAEIIDEFDLGGVILFAQNVQTTEQTAKLTHDMQQVAINDADGNLPLLITIDQEGGIVTRLGTGTNFPGNMAIGATKNEKSSYDTGSVIGKELDSLGINVNFAPSVDVNNNPANPVIGLRSFSSNPDLVSKLGVQMIKGIQNQGVSAAAKHFPGHGDTATDSHYGLPVVDKSIDELREVELKPFQAAIDNGVDMIMTAHIQFPQVEKDTYTSKKDGEEIQIPATLSDDILTGLLREDMNYDGVIITDALNMAAIAENFGEVEAVKMAFDAGVDIALMPTILRSKEDVPKLRAVIQGVKEAVNSGELSLERINESAERIVKLKIDRGILEVEKDTRTVEEKIKNAQNVVGSKENRDIERRVSAEAITVVRNEENILPLNPKEGEKILLVAPYDNEIPGMKFGVSRLINEGKLQKAEIDTYTYNKEGSISEELKSKIDEANYIIVISEMGNYSHLAPTSWITSTPKEIVNYSNETGKDSVIVSVGKPYDIATHKDAKAEVVAYGYKGMDPTESDGGLSPVKAFGPNIPAAIEVIFGGAKAEGTLPVSVPDVDENGNPNLEKNSFEYGFGITNLTEVGATSIETPIEVEVGEEFEVKLNIKDIDSLKSEKYLLSLGLNSEYFDVVSVKSASKEIEYTLENSEIKVTLENEIKNEEDLTLKLKAKKECNDINIIDSVKVIDNKDRVFNTTLEKKKINIIKEKSPIETPNDKKPSDNESSNGNTDKNNSTTGKNPSGKLPNTGSKVSTSIVGFFGAIMAIAGASLFRRKK